MRSSYKENTLNISLLLHTTKHTARLHMKTILMRKPSILFIAASTSCFWPAKWYPSPCIRYTSEFARNNGKTVEVA